MEEKKIVSFETTDSIEWVMLTLRDIGDMRNLKITDIEEVSNAKE